MKSIGTIVPLSRTRKLSEPVSRRYRLLPGCRRGRLLVELVLAVVEVLV